jgi:hypothetical protein
MLYCSGKWLRVKKAQRGGTRRTGTVSSPKELKLKDGVAEYELRSGWLRRGSTERKG